MSDIILELEKIFRALGDRNRLRLLGLLAEEARCVCELQAVLKLAQSTVSEHLQVLVAAGLVISRPAGFWTDYLLNPAQGRGHDLVKIVAACLKNDPRFKKDLVNVRRVNRKNICCSRRVKK